MRWVGRPGLKVHESIGQFGGRIRPNLRRAVCYCVVALAALIAGGELHRHAGSDALRIASYACAAAVLVFGALAARSTANELGYAIAHHAGRAAAEPVHIGVQLLGYLLTVLAVLTVLQVNLSQFLVGGALTGIVLGIAAQQALGNLFAGLVLMLARPYEIGDHVTVYSGAINGPHQGEIAGLSLLYTTLATANGLLRVPNGVLLGSGVGLPKATPETDLS